MKRVLYITNIEVPYRTIFFNLLAKECDLTVLFERRCSSNRNNKWAVSSEKLFDVAYLDGWNVGNENSFSLEIFGWLKKKWDFIIVGCCNSKVQLAAMMYMRLKKIPYIVNFDGEQFINSGIKSKIKRFILRNAKFYLVAGEKSGESIQKGFGYTNIVPYYFSSLTDEELKNNSKNETERDEYVLVVGQYFDYKGMDVALECARNTPNINYKFVGMGVRTEIFIKENGRIPDNVEIIPFLQKEQLQEEFKRCKVFVLPSRQECWGLVINEAASWGTPIVSTLGSGAAVEFLIDSKFSNYLSYPNDIKSLQLCIEKCYFADNKEYSLFLKEKSKEYSIEKSVKVHMSIINL